MLQTIRALERYKLDIPIAIEQFDNTIISFIYYMVLDKNIQIGVIYELLKEVNIKYVHRCTIGVQLMFYLSKISCKLAIMVIRWLKT